MLIKIKHYITRRTRKKSTRNAKARAETYNRHIKELINNNDSKKIDSLHELYIKNDVNSKAIPDVWWQEFITACQTENNQNSSRSEWLHNAASELDYAAMSCREWLDIYNTLLSFGLFYSASPLRAKAKEAAIHNTGSKNKSDLNYKLTALFEDCDRHDRDEIISIISHTGKGEYAKKDFEYFIDLINKRKETQPEFDTSEIEFYKYIKGSSIAFVGPVSIEENKGHEIDAYDIVARTNYRTNDQINNTEEQGSRTDVSYYNSLQFEAIIKEQEGKLPKNLKFGILKRPKHKDLITSNTVKLTMHDNKKFVFNGHLNAIPHAIMHLLRFNPGEIKIYGADLMVTKQRYANYRPKSLGESDQGLVFVNHDPLTQFNLLHLMWRNSLLFCDEQLESVIKLGESRYMWELEQSRGDSSRVLNE